MQPWIHNALPVVSGILLSIVVPLGIFLGRSNIRARRFEIINDLVTLFSFAVKAGGDPLIIPSFELVKYKYQPRKSGESENPDSSNGINYAIPVFVYVVLCQLGFFIAFADSTIVKLLIPSNAYLSSSPFGLDQTADPMLVLVIEAFTFLGGYVWTLQYLVRRISNFDLSPLSFFRCTVHLLFGLCNCSPPRSSGLDDVLAFESCT